MKKLIDGLYFTLKYNTYTHVKYNNHKIMIEVYYMSEYSVLSVEAMNDTMEVFITIFSKRIGHEENKEAIELIVYGILRDIDKKLEDML